MADLIRRAGKRVRAVVGRLEPLSEQLVWRIYHHTLRLVADDPDWQDVLLVHLEPRAGERILVLGLGAAAKALAWAQQRPKAHFIAVDLSMKAATRARAEAEKRKIDNVEVKPPSQKTRLDHELLRLEADSIDAVFSYLAAEHLSQDNKALLRRECLRVLRRRGRWLLACLDTPQEPGEMIASVLLRVTYGSSSAGHADETLPGLDLSIGKGLKFRRLAVLCASRSRVALFSARKPGSDRLERARNSQ